MTSNAGTSDLPALKASGFTTASLSEKAADTAKRDAESISKALKELFRPEFLNRVDEIVIFNRLSEDNIRAITRKLLNEVGERMKLNNAIELVFDETLVSELAAEGFDPVYGARPLKRAIQKRVEDTLSTDILEGKITSGDKITVSYEDGKTKAERS
ncbi:ATP-dependent Clp protease ATP-binding subunit ClpC [bioreactor metagenome]|uniref:ATP-dependent Clp protease ATP-binding subunit ClpC n=1 Tax=bioreactor metagenome TaxID=1076179 RepID=A0A645G7G7_9ZZZZ